VVAAARARHGARFCCADASSWPVPDAAVEVTDDVYGDVTVAAWHQLHPKQRTYREPGGALSIVEGTLIRLHVSRLPGRRDREPKTVWLWWPGDDPSGLDLDRIWRAYLRGFDIEHTFRFAKQTLGWTTPKLRTPEQADRWTWLIAAAFTQLRLARPLVSDHRLPWQPHQPAHAFTPGRVRQGFAHLLPRIGTPASHPKPTRPGPGRPKGSRSTPAQRHPAIKKPGQDPETTKPTLNAKLRVLRCRVCRDIARSLTRLSQRPRADDHLVALDHEELIKSRHIARVVPVMEMTDRDGRV
jgi:hypothetical protein